MMRQFAFFVDKEHQNTLSELRKYLQNFEVLQTAFGDLDGKSMDDISVLEEIQSNVDTANRSLSQAFSISRSFGEVESIHEPGLCESAFLTVNHRRRLLEWYPRWKSRLVYRATRDAGKSFYQCCGGISLNIIVVKTTDGQIFGCRSSCNWKDRIDPKPTQFILSPVTQFLQDVGAASHIMLGEGLIIFPAGLKATIKQPEHPERITVAKFIPPKVYDLEEVEVFESIN